MENKKCSGCNNVYPYTNEYFNYKNKLKGELQSRCKNCTRESIKKSRLKNGRECLIIDLSSKDKNLIEKNAKKVGLDVSKYIRYVALKNQPIIIKDLVELEPIEKTIGNIEFQIKRLGVNVNQISKNLNEGGSISEDTVISLINVLEKLNLRMMEIEKVIAKGYENLY